MALAGRGKKPCYSLSMSEQGFISDLSALSEFRALREKQRSFVFFYLADPKRVACKAVLRAGLTDNENSARVMGSKLLANGNILAAVKAGEEFLQSSDHLLGRMVAKLTAIAFADIRDVARWDARGGMTLIPSAELSDEAAHSLASIQEIVEEKQQRLPGLDDKADVDLKIMRKNVKQHSPLEAMKLLAQICGVGEPQRLEISTNSERLERAFNESA